MNNTPSPINIGIARGNRKSMCRRFLLSCALAMLIPQAYADYKVWYYDDNAWFEYGDLSAGNVKMVPPSWACGRRFFDPSYYRWVGEYSNTIAADDFWENVHVWLPLDDDCPHEQILIEDQDGGESYPAPLGTHYMEISTNYGGYWIDKDGGWPACNCSIPTTLKLLASNIDWSVFAEIMNDVQVALSPTQPERSAQALLDDAQRRLEPLARELSKVIAERRRQSFGELESTVGALEDHALAEMQGATVGLETCQRYASASRKANALVACSGAGESARAAQRVLHTIRHEVEH